MTYETLCLFLHKSLHADEFRISVRLVVHFSFSSPSVLFLVQKYILSCWDGDISWAHTAIKQSTANC